MRLVELYLHAFYSIIVTMSTMGYGDVTPANNFEIIFVILFILVGMWAFCGKYKPNANRVILRNISRKITECQREFTN